MTLTPRSTALLAFASIITVSACSGGGGGSEPSKPPPVPANRPPVVDAGADQTVAEASLVTLTGTVTDPDSTPVLRWTQTGGAPVALQGADTAEARFTAPDVDADAVLSFRLTADDGVNSPVSDTVQVTVRDQGVVVVRVSPEGESYIDHELHPDRDEMVFQRAGEIWIGALDPATGLFAGGDGLDQRVSPSATPLDQARNGPEYGVDADGTAIYFNRTAPDGAIEVWRAEADGSGGFSLAQISPPGLDRINPLPRRDRAADAVHVAYARLEPGGPPCVIGTLVSLNEDTGAETGLTPARQGFAGFRWISEGGLLAFTVADGPEEGQIALFDADAGATRVITDDAGVKFDPYPWSAPEHGGTTMISAIVDQSDVALYRDQGAAGFERVATLSPPPESGLQFIQSPEPFVYQGRSYIILTVKDDPGGIATAVADAQIWIYGIEAGPDGAAAVRLRCDDGASNRIRSEGEVDIGPEGDLRVCYNEREPSGRFSIKLCRAGFVLAAD